MDEERVPVESHDDRVDILNLPGWTILDEHEEEHLYQFSIQSKERVSSCPLCQTVIVPYRFGTREHTFTDLPMHGKHVRLLAKRRRYRCKVCHKTFLDPIPYMSEQHSATTRLINYIERETLALTSRTFLGLSYEVGVTEDTIRHIFDTCVSHLEQT